VPDGLRVQTGELNGFTTLRGESPHFLLTLSGTFGFAQGRLSEAVRLQKN